MSGTVARPKIYIDYINYFRATGLGVNTDALNTNINEDYSELFSYNPSNTKTFTPTNESLPLNFDVLLGSSQPEELKLIQSINFGAILNHNINSTDNQYIDFRNIINNSYSDITQSITVGQDKNNFHLREWTSGNESNGLSCEIAYSNYDSPLRLGSIIAGRSYTFPHNSNLSMNINYDADGIRSSRTLGGHDIVDINYYKQPDWDGNPPFVATNASGLSATSHIGRRSWALTFSFLTATDTFPQDMGENFMFDNYFPDNGLSTWTNHSTENLVSHVMTLTMNGQLGFLFQPDDTKNTFAWCKLRSNSFSVQQSAPNLYTCKMTFDETF